MSSIKGYSEGKSQSLVTPPKTEVGTIGWIRHNLFSTPLNTLLTCLGLWFLWIVLPPLFEWMFLDSIWVASSRKECWDKMRVPEGAACWAFIGDRLNLFTYGFYPENFRWRVNLSFLLLILAITPVLYDKMPKRKPTRIGVPIINTPGRIISRKAALVEIETHSL